MFERLLHLPIFDLLLPWKRLAQDQDQIAKLTAERDRLKAAMQRHDPKRIWERLYERESEYLGWKEKMPEAAREKWGWAITQYIDMIPPYYRFVDAERYPIFQPLALYLARIGATVDQIDLNSWSLRNGQVLYIQWDANQYTREDHRSNSGMYLSVAGTPHHYKGNPRLVNTFSWSSGHDFSRRQIRQRDVMEALEKFKQFWEVDRHA